MAPETTPLTLSPAAIEQGRLIDVLRERRAAYRRGEITYDVLKQHAIDVLQHRQQTETARFGKAKTVITAKTIAYLLRVI